MSASFWEAFAKGLYKKEERMRHNEISPREREDEERRFEHDFGVTQMADEDAQGERHLQTEQGQPEGWINE